ncbi:MAG TPA: inorganic diphosphatase [Candidatus Magasanikbacteria bacterium]|nr:inorganic diphosphatase [Candidatus Magasanikbacteria bacterium]
MESQNAWHSVSIGEDSPKVVQAIIEISKGSKGKFELDKETGLIKLDRVLFSAVHYPTNYGFIPQTYCDDKDPLDILVLSTVDLPPLCLVEARVVGVMGMIDGGEGDDKIIAVAKGDPNMKHINELEDLPQHTLDEIKQFFEEYKKLEKKTVEVKGFEGKERALEVVEESIKLYQKTFK